MKKTLIYETPEIQVICIEPDESIMTDIDGEVVGVSLSMPTAGVGPM